ncbi:hypothetical protein DW985_05380, partial [Bacteroides ovatus]
FKVTKKQTYLQLLIGLRKKKTVEIKKRLPPNLTKNRNLWFFFKFRATYLCSITLFMAIPEYFKMHIVWIIYLLFLICRYPFIHRPFNELY